MVISTSVAIVISASVAVVMTYCKAMTRMRIAGTVMWEEKILDRKCGILLHVHSLHLDMLNSVRCNTEVL